MRRNRITIKPEWMRIGNIFSLLVEIEDKIFTKKFKVYCTDESAQSVIELNKKLKQFDLAEDLRREFNVKKVDFV